MVEREPAREYQEVVGTPFRDESIDLEPEGVEHLYTDNYIRRSLSYIVGISGGVRHALEVTSDGKMQGDVAIVDSDGDECSVTSSGNLETCEGNLERATTEMHDAAPKHVATLDSAHGHINDWNAYDADIGDSYSSVASWSKQTRMIEVYAESSGIDVQATRPDGTQKSLGYVPADTGRQFKIMCTQVSMKEHTGGGGAHGYLTAYFHVDQ